MGKESKESVCLLFKMPSSKLRDATGGGTRGGAATRRSVNVFTENPIVSGPRTSRPRKKLVEVNTSDEEDMDDQEEDEVDDEDAPGEDDEDADADGDLDMDDAPPQPPVSKRHAKASATSAATSKPVKSVEAKEMEVDDDDDEDDEEELSEPDSDAEGEPDDLEESTLGNVNGGDEELDDDDLDESDDGLPSTDPSKMTKRQRGNLGNDFLQLPMEPQVKKHLTAEERQMRRAEMARRRKNLSEKRNEEEKMDTINRLLRKQAPKRRGRIPAAEAAEASADQEAQEVERADPTMVRWVSGRDGSRVSVPEEWFGTPAGRVFGAGPLGNSGPRKLVEEV